MRDFNVLLLPPCPVASPIGREFLVEQVEDVIRELGVLLIHFDQLSTSHVGATRRRKRVGVTMEPKCIILEHPKERFQVVGEIYWLIGVKETLCR